MSQRAIEEIVNVPVVQAPESIRGSRSASLCCAGTGSICCGLMSFSAGRLFLSWRCMLACSFIPVQKRSLKVVPDAL